MTASISTFSDGVVKRTTDPCKYNMTMLIKGALVDLSLTLSEDGVRLMLRLLIAWRYSTNFIKLHQEMLSILNLFVYIYMYLFMR